MTTVQRIIHDLDAIVQNPSLLADLTRDRGWINLARGFELRSRIEPDDTPISEWDCYGTLEWGNRGGDIHPRRPDDFDGSAEILERGGHADLWWMPPRDVTNIGPKAVDALRLTVTDILHYGFSVMTIELWGTALDALGAPHTVMLTSASIGEIEPGADDEGLTALAADLVWGIARDLDASAG